MTQKFKSYFNCTRIKIAKLQKRRIFFTFCPSFIQGQEKVCVNFKGKEEIIDDSVDTIYLLLQQNNKYTFFFLIEKKIAQFLQLNNGKANSQKQWHLKIKSCIWDTSSKCKFMQHTLLLLKTMGKNIPFMLYLLTQTKCAVMTKYYQ